MCRAAQSDYYEQRRVLRGLPPHQPPRELWARTSAALDHEMARQPWPAGRRRLVPRTALVGTAAVLSIALVLGSAQLGLAPAPVQPTDNPRTSLPTPFGVTPQRMGFVGSTVNGLVLYRTQLSQVCPISAPTCLGEADLAPEIVNLPRNVNPGSLSVSPDGASLAMIGRQSGRESIIAFVLEDDGPLDVPARPTPPSATTLAAPSDPPLPPAAPPSYPSAPLPAEVPSAAAEVLPSPPVVPATDSSSPAPPSPAQVSPAPADSQSVSPAATSLPSLVGVIIVDDVYTAGAPPAWAPSGQLLAFSAMPADRSHGPDIYIWREGDETAERLTSDHSTYFASWSGQRIVASRVVRPDEGDDSLSLRTVVIDPLSGEERELAGHDLWLPQVSPLGDLAVVWQGNLELSATTAQPSAGALYLTDWQALDPFRAGEQPTHGEPSADPAAAPLREGLPWAQPATHDSEGDESSPPTPPTVPADSDDRPAPAPSTQAGASENPATGEPGINSQPTPEPVLEAPLLLVALEPERDPLDQAVRDWLVRWSVDGSVVGYWISDAAGASWGQLAVVNVGSSGPELAVGETLLPSTLARRSFTLGVDRVAWVGPIDEEIGGEVRIRTWGPGGEGGLRLPSLDLREVVPAF